MFSFSISVSRLRVVLNSFVSAMGLVVFFITEMNSPSKYVSKYVLLRMTDYRIVCR